MKNKGKDEYRFSVRATEKEKSGLKKVASVVGIPQSIIIREAIAEKIADLTARVERGEEIKLGVVTK